jgi:hypothetical protein
LDDPLGVARKIKDINAHPLWTSYIIPPVLGLAIRLYYYDKEIAEILRIFDQYVPLPSSDYKKSPPF